MEKKNDIHSAICRVMEDVGVVTGTGKNAHHKYQYASEHDLLLAVQPSIARHGISVSKKSVDILNYEKTGRNWHCMVSIHYVLTLSVAFASDGAERHLDQICIGCGEDFADKAIAKASTMAYKYLWRQALGIPTGDDPDATRNSRRAPEKQTPKPTPKQTPKPTPKQTPEKPPKNWKEAATSNESEPTPIQRLKAWSIRCYHGYDDMDQFCRTLQSKTSPETWGEEKIARFMLAFDSDSRISDAYHSWRKKVYAEIPF